MSVFQFVKAQLGENLLEKISKRHSSNKQTFFELLQSMTGVRIDSHYGPEKTYIIEGTWEALERCHTVLYKYHAELCAEELADLADQQQYPYLSPACNNHLGQMKKPSPDSTSCAPLEPITPSSNFNGCSDASISSPVISALPLAQSMFNNERSSASPVAASRGLDLSLKSMTSALGLFNPSLAAHLTSSANPLYSSSLSLGSTGAYALGGNPVANVNGNGLDTSHEEDNDNASVDGSSDYSHDSPIDIESTTPSSKSALDCLMDMKVEPSSVKCSDSQYLACSPQSDQLSMNGDVASTTSSVAGSVSSGVRHRRPVTGSRSRLSASTGSNFMPNKTDQTKVHPCPFCPVTLGSSMNLKKHIQRKHSTPLHKCDICGKAYGFVNDLREHKKIHFLNLPCNQCEKIFKSRRSLLGHLSIAHKDSGVPPPPPPPAGPFTSPLAPTPPADSRSCSMANGIAASASVAVAVAESTQQLNLSLYSSLSAINSYFTGAGLDLDLSNSSVAGAEKQSMTSSSVAHNLLSEFDKRLGAGLKTSVGTSSCPISSNASSRAVTTNTTCSASFNGDVLNLTKSDLSSSSPMKIPTMGEDAKGTVTPSVPMEVSVQ